MPFVDPQPEPADMAGFVRLCGAPLWRRRLAEIQDATRGQGLGARQAQQRFALELTLARLTDPASLARASHSERRVGALAREAVQVAASLPAAARRRFKDMVEAALTGDANLVPIFHLLRTAALHRARGFDVVFGGLRDGGAHDLDIARDGVAAEVACETVSADDGREVHRGDWCALVDRVNPELQTWLAAHPGRYLLKMTLPEGMATDEQVAELHRRISTMLAGQRRQEQAACAVLKLDPLMLAGAHVSATRLPATLRAQFGEEAHLAVTTAPGSGSVFVMAARAGRENSIAGAVTRRLSAAAPRRLSGERPGILSVFVEDVDRLEWRGLRDRMELEGAARRWMTDAAARPVVAVTCASRMELLGIAPPDAALNGELRFRNPNHPQARNTALAAAILSSV
jgi:hypothetical protein